MYGITFSNGNDVNTLVPFLNNLHKFTKRKYENLIADAGYESEENYEYLRKNNITAYIKPQNYKQSKTQINLCQVENNLWKIYLHKKE